jgi:hypothetical protein
MGMDQAGTTAAGAAQTDSATAVLAVHTCNRLCRPANPPTMRNVFTEWWRRAAWRQSG